VVEGLVAANAWCQQPGSYQAQRWLADRMTELKLSLLPARPEGCRGGKSRFMRRLIVPLVTALLVSGGLGWAGLGLAAGSAQAGALHWCPGDPPPQAVKPGGGYIAVSPDWDTTVCHDYAIRGGQVMDGNPCSLPQFQ
jgi:hypothetical protein